MKISASTVALLSLASTAIAQQEGGLRPNVRELQDPVTASAETRNSLCTACDVLDFCNSLGDFCSNDDILNLACGACDGFGVPGLCSACDVCDSVDFCDADLIVGLACGFCDGDDNGGGDDSEDNTSPPIGEIPDLCFSEVATVQMVGSTIAMKDLKIGDKILTDSGNYETVYAFGHHHATKQARFLQIHNSENADPLEVTPGHLVFLQDKATPVPSQTIKVGDILRTSANAAGSTVTKIGSIERKGIYAPLTAGGTVVVDGVTASSYIELGAKQHLSDHDLIHMALSPYRMLCNGVSDTFCDTRFYLKESGMPFYAHYGLGLLHWLLASNVVIRTVGLSIIFALTGACQLLEDVVGSSSAPLVVFLAALAYTTQSKNNSKKGKAKLV